MSDDAGWQPATIIKVTQETPRVKSLTLAPEQWTAHRAGQHCHVRVALPGGRLQERSYSIASAPEQTGEIDITVERLDAGEVSMYIHGALGVGDRVYVRGPLGERFIWEAGKATGPLFLIAGGSGIAPLMSILRHRCAAASTAPATLLYSARSPGEVIFTRDLQRLAQGPDRVRLIYAFTRAGPLDGAGPAYRRRVDTEMLRELLPRSPDALAYVCGPALFVEAVANTLVRLGMPVSAVRTEGFVPTGAPALRSADELVELE